MRELVEVVDRPLNLRGPQFAVGERLHLDLDNPRHRECLDRGWVRRVAGVVPGAAPPAPATATTADVPAPPADRMMRSQDDPAPDGRGRRGRTK